MILEPIINTHKVKYTVLDEIVKNMNIGKDIENINIYINLDSIFGAFYRDDIADNIKSLNNGDHTTLCAEIANIAAHYRRYFWTRHYKKTTFYFYYMNKKPKFNREIYPEYADNLIERKKKSNIKYHAVNKIIKDNLMLFAIMCPLLPKVYLSLSEKLEPSLIPYHFIKKSKDTDYNIVLTKDEYEFQLLGLENTEILRLSSDKTFLINRDTLVLYLLKSAKYKPNNFIDGRYYENILPLITCKSRNVKAIKGYGKVALLKRIDKNFEHLSPELSFNLLLSIINVDVTNEVFDRYKIMNLKSQYKRLSKIEKIRLEEFVQDKFENSALMQFNTEYFPYNPIKLVELYDGVDMY